ncbi:nicotinate-nucleotide adenylyltransferase [Metabacillus iocasae]|uniref:Probable nicotinate-nucleotide adenylyltransferase n=1 Tax=Priestia iocasae TaxID=2291674 RepID=A0ABS2QPW4_9BACI|nr:nicotinate-nucleotide adenylyltransferase [Metabacillus iocasae]MBM7701450.1 nicotinate-nucleotide adenylyltransferase [Metabacillus iocasae]
MKRIAILGGTFNPPHLGHLIIANEVFYTLNLDECWFMPSYTPPHKEVSDEVNPEHRLRMLELAIKGQEHFSVQDIEFDRKGTSYTFDTIRLLKELYPDVHFYFVVGGDMVEYLPKWHRIEELVHLVTFVGVKRPGYELRSSYPVEFVEVPQVDISSSLIRERVNQGHSIQYLVPNEIKAYIEENGLYESR